MSQWDFTEKEIEQAKKAEPLPFDASWSTGDQDFDARIHASLLKLKLAQEEIANLAHPEFGDMGRLQEEIHDLKKEVARVQALESEAVMQAERDAKRADKNAAEVGHWKQARETAMAAGEVLKAQLDDLKKEVEWLRFYKREVYACLGPADDEINRDIRRAYVKKVGLDGLSEKLRNEHLEYENDHKED